MKAPKRLPPLKKIPCVATNGVDVVRAGVGCAGYAVIGERLDGSRVVLKDAADAVTARALAKELARHCRQYRRVFAEKVRVPHDPK